MDEHILVGLSAVVALGISAQWFAWRTKLPAILVLLIFGIVAGPVTGWINPDELLGDILSPFVSFSVAIILFEGGLSLRMAEFRKIGGVVIKLITVGIAITWFLAALAAYYLLGLSIEIAVLFGAILIVTGPTVIIPLLRQVRPTETAGSVLKWEGIVNDPIGAMMAVLYGDDNLLANSLDNPPTTQLGDLIIIFHRMERDPSDDLGLIPYSMQLEPTV
ncbi:MAG: cation:proton antiporter [Bacteroidetes bacterium]|nr:cation:proton antiporter [Bacteroidota bacterium]MDA1126849.1 cation:proton antiporter [Bacteroidota bacterium]